MHRLTPADLRAEAARLRAESETLENQAIALELAADEWEASGLLERQQTVTITSNVRGNHLPHADSSRLAISAKAGGSPKVAQLRERGMTLLGLARALTAAGSPVSGPQLSRIFSGTRSCPPELAQAIERLTTTANLPGIKVG